MRNLVSIQLLIRRLTIAIDRLSSHRRATAFWGLVGLLGFAGGAILSVRSIDFRSLTPQVWPLILVGVVGVPAGVLLTAREYHISTKVAKVDVPYRAALRTSITAAAANMLPLPGGAAVRISDLARSGGSPLSAAGVTAVLGILWVSVAAVASGVALLITGASLSGIIFGSIGLILLIFGWLAFRLAKGEARQFRSILLVELASIVVGGFRLWLVFKSLDLALPLSKPIVIATSNVLASAVGVVPGGLGLREGFAAALAPLVSIEPGIAFVAAGINQIIAIIVQMPLLVLLWRRAHR